MFLLLLLKVGTAQEFRLLSEEDKWDIRLQSHVLIDIDQITSSNLPVLLNGRTSIALYILDYQENYDTILEQLMVKNDSLILVTENIFSKDLLSQSWVPQISMQKIEAITLDALPNGEDALEFDTVREFGVVRVLDKEFLNDSVFVDIWRRSGKMPNFIQIDPELFPKADSLVFDLNMESRVFGTVRSKSGLLNGVSFKNHRNLIVNGHFSLPIDPMESLPVFIPHKAGYYFSPDIIYTTPENRGNLKEFIGFPLDFEYGLTDHFTFGPTIKNAIRKNDKELIVNSVKIQQDEVHGKVGHFDKGAYVDAGLDSRTALEGSFTISSWVRPTVLTSNNSILGKGDNFVLKLHEGLLTFTMADIKDYISQTSPVPLNEWTHVALVHSKVNNELLFFVNGVQTDKIKLIENYDTSDYNIVIGSNLWQEFFIGYLTNIKIWKRELNANEIAKEYQKIEVNDADVSSLYIKIGIAIAAFLLIFLAFKFWKKGTIRAKLSPAPERPVKKYPSRDQKSLINAAEKILCFGSLRIINSEGFDIAKKLSPKLKQLFVIVLLHSIGDKDGISTKKLTEALWPGMSPKNAKNTRGTNIQNLRAILSEAKEMNLIFLDKSWFLEIGNNCFCDYQEVLNYLNDLGRSGVTVAYLEEQLPQLFSILKADRFFVNMSDSWLDPIVENMSNRIIEFCYDISKILDMDKHSVLMYDLASVMNIYDDLNEHALQIKLQILIRQGKLSLAHTAYDNFAKLYEKIYGEMYTVKFEDMAVSNPL
ncbi:LamG domain-containing protein [Arenibacter echinorum]|uniref:LamG domain-containing protein n=1 Tax=Arenibacter echinorum TaxID=440515 RepID=UPI0011B94329|nr:LamG-like jellyroll fold domain-containing protein [Arenibacter echinorum]